MIRPSLLFLVLVLALLSFALHGCFVFRSSPSSESLRLLNQYVYGGYERRDPVVRELLTRSGAERFIGRLAWPVEGAKIGSGFGMRLGRMHSGVDFPAKLGTEVRAGCTGRIVVSEDNVGRYGHLVGLLCGPLVLVYAHLDVIGVEVGETVRQGESLGEVGKSGNATGPHLHFETRVLAASGRYVAVDPRIFLSPERSERRLR